MSVLTDEQIERALDFGALVVDPLDKSLINSTSLDFRLGNTFTWIDYGNETHTNAIGNSHSVINPLNKDSFVLHTIETNSIVLRPHEFILATTLETFDFKGYSDRGISAKVMGKSSLGRLGLTNSSQAGWIDAGFRGPITLELRNDSENYLKLTAGMKIGQLVMYMSAAPKYDYKKTGRYLDQKPGQGSKGV